MILAALFWWFLVSDAAGGAMTEPEVRGPYTDLRVCEGMSRVIFQSSGYRLRPVRIGGRLNKDETQIVGGVTCILSETAPARLTVAR